MITRKNVSKDKSCFDVIIPIFNEWKPEARTGDQPLLGLTVVLQ